MFLTLTSKQKKRFVKVMQELNNIEKQTEKQIQHERKTLWVSFCKDFVTVENYARTRKTQQKRGKDRAEDIEKAIEKHKQGEKETETKRI